MIVLNCSNLTFAFGDKLIVENASFSINHTDKVGIVGINGAGKTTLFKIIFKILYPESGMLYIPNDKKIGYLQQNTDLTSNKTIWDELACCFKEVITLERRIFDLQQNISTEKSQNRLESLMTEYDTLNEQFVNMDGFAYHSRIKGVLFGLGFTVNQFNLSIQTLSGGQKTKLALAKLLLRQPDILLLDEPTNHLDVASLEWLEEFLKSFPKCVMVISHDRYFLDAVTNKTLEVENATISLYNGNYTTYIEKKSANLEIQQRHYENQQKEMLRMEEMIKRFKQWNREKTIKKAESKQKMLDKIEKLDRPNTPSKNLDIAFTPDITSGKEVLLAEHLTKAYPGKTLFDDVTFTVRRGEKVFLLGPNGCGKSTLLKILTSNLEKDDGTFNYGHNVKIGYYDQEQQNLTPTNTVLDEIWHTYDNLTSTEVRNALAAYFFTGDDVFKSISQLSGGEKSRVALLKLMLSGANLLILDEPTNHLDIQSREALEKSLENYPGTVLAVSHDRYFIHKLSTRILEMTFEELIDYPGNYEDYIRHKKNMLSKLHAIDTSKDTSSKKDYAQQKAEKAQRQRTEKQLNETEKEIAALEKQLETITEAMIQDQNVQDHEKLQDLYNQQLTAQQTLEQLYQKWEALEETLSEFA